MIPANSRPKHGTAFRPNSVAAIFGVAALLISTFATAQPIGSGTRQKNLSKGFDFKEIGADSLLRLPLDSYRLQPRDTNSIVIKNGTMFYWTTVGGFYHWDSVKAKGAGGAGISDGDKVDINVTGSGATWQIKNNAVTNAKINDVGATKVTQDASHRFATDVEKSFWNGRENPLTFSSPFLLRSINNILLDTAALFANNPLFSNPKRVLYDTTAQIIPAFGANPAQIRSKLLGQDFAGLGVSDRNIGGALSTDSSNNHIVDAKVVGTKSIQELRTLVPPGGNATDTQWLFKLNNYTRKFTQEYQYDPTDVTTPDDSAFNIVGAGGRRYKAIIHEYVDAALFDMVPGTNVTAFLQLAVNKLHTHAGTKTLLISNATYTINGSVTVPSDVSIYVGPGGLLTGSGTITGGTIYGNERQQLFTTSITIHPDAVAWVWSMKWYGATGSGLVDDGPAMQKSFDACAYMNQIKHIYFPSGIYSENKGTIFQRDDNGDGVRDFPTGYIIEGEAAAFGGTGEVIIRLNNNSSFALDFQKCKKFLIKNIYVDGGNTSIGSLTYSQVFEGAGSLWDNGFRTQINSPHAGFLVDGVGIPSMGSGTKYPDFTSSYSDPATGGSTDITFEDCAAFNCIVGFGISVNGTTQNGDMVSFNSCWTYQNKYAFVTGSSQNRSTKINKCGIWGRVFTLFDCTTFGDNIGDPPQIEELNTAGLNKYLCNLNTFANAGLTINNSHFESLWSLGGCFTGESGKLTMTNDWIAMAGSFLPGDGSAIHPPKTVFRGRTLNMTNCFFSYYQSGTTPFTIDALGANFTECGLDNIVINNLASIATTNFDKCYGGNGIFQFGDNNILQKIDPAQISGNLVMFNTNMTFIPEFSAGDFFVSLTRKKVNRTLGQFGFGGKDFQQIDLGTYTPSNIVAVNGTYSSTTADITLAHPSTELSILQVGDYLLTQTTDEYGRTSVLTAIGQIYAINTTTGVVSLKTTMIGLSATSYRIWLYRQPYLIPTFAVGTATAGTNTITDVVQETGAVNFPTGVTLNSNYFPEGTYIVSYNSGTRVLTVSNNATGSATLMDILCSDYQMVQFGYPNVSLAARLGYKQGDMIWNKRQDINADVLFFICTKSGVTGSTRLPEFRAFYKNMAPALANDAAADVWGLTFYRNTTSGYTRIKNGSTWLDVPTWDANTNITNSSGAVSINTQNGSAGLTVDALQHTLIKRGIAWQSTQPITSGTSSTVGDNIITVVFDPASVIATYTLTLPATPVDGQEVRIEFGGTVAGGAAVVTALTISANSGQALMQSAAPTTANGGDCFIYQYRLSNTKWYRVK